MIKTANRLKTKFEFKITKKYGALYSNDYAYINVLKPTNYIGEPKIGVSTSKKIEKSAVKRNRVKRYFLRIIRDNLNNIPKNYWITIYPTKKSFKVTYEEISANTNSLLSKISFS